MPEPIILGNYFIPSFSLNLYNLLSISLSASNLPFLLH